MKQLLKDYDSKSVDVFISYLETLKTEKDKDGKVIAWWFSKITDEQFANVFKKVADQGLVIDGDSITLNFRKKLIITYDYHAYKNKVIISYPETIFDFGLVYDGDTFSFRKESGKIIYSHKSNDPFNSTKKLIGAYGVIKNSKGEFIEFLTLSDIDKMQKTSTMKGIWNTWYDRMVLKSIIKRICTVHFKDITKDIDNTDNETNDPERATISELIQKDIDGATTEKELTEIYNNNIGKIEDVESFINILTKKKKELKNDKIS